MIRWPAGDHWAERFLQLRGRKQLAIRALASVGHPKDDALIFVANMTEEMLGNLAPRQGCLLLLSEAQRDVCEPLERCHGVLYSEDPRYQFAEALDGLWDAASLRGHLARDSDRDVVLGENVQIHPSAVVEPGATIASDCVIARDVYVMSGARIGPRVQIGRGSVVRENAVIGGYGFGFATAPGKPKLRIPHVGGVRIGEDVEIGALVTVCSGTIDSTIVDDGVKVDDHVHIGHNCHVAEQAVITACAEISGSVKVGARTWLAPNCSIIDRISIGSDCVIGMGAVVTKSVGDHTTVVGNPARPLRKRAQQEEAARESSKQDER